MTPRRRILPIFVPHAGCPNDCVFCNQKRISGSLLPASAETVRAAVSELEPASGYELAFYGGSFTAIPETEQEVLLAAVIPARKSGAVSAIRVSTRPDAVTEEKLARLRFYGVETVELGAQSMCDEVLLRSGRGHTSEDTVKAAKLVKDAGFMLILQMMTGVPGSDDALDIQTARAIAALRPDGVRIYLPSSFKTRRWRNSGGQGSTRSILWRTPCASAHASCPYSMMPEFRSSVWD